MKWACLSRCSSGWTTPPLSGSWCGSCVESLTLHSTSTSIPLHSTHQRHQPDFIISWQRALSWTKKQQKNLKKFRIKKPRSQNRIKSRIQKGLSLISRSSLPWRSVQLLIKNNVDNISPCWFSPSLPQIYHVGEGGHVVKVLPLSLRDHSCYTRVTLVSHLRLTVNS